MVTARVAESDTVSGETGVCSEKRTTATIYRDSFGD